MAIIQDALSIQVEETRKYFNTPYSHIRYRVVGINGREISDDRFIYMDNNKYCWYAKNTPAEPKKYSYSSYGYQQVLLNGIIYRINTWIKLEVRQNIAAVTAPAVVQYKGDLTVDKVYRLENGVKMQLVAKVSAGDFASECTYVGVYKNGTIRYSADGKLLSHGGKDEWSIECEWKNIELWVITYCALGGKFRSTTWTSEAAADAYVKEHKLFVIAKTKITT